MYMTFFFFFFFSSRRRHTRWTGDWSSDVCSSDLEAAPEPGAQPRIEGGPRLRRDGMAVLGEELLPHLGVALLHPGELDVDVLAVGIGLLAGEHEIQVGGVELVLPVVQPGVQRGLVEGRHA